MKEEMNSRPRPKVILMDVYDTMLNMSEIERRINAYFNNKLAYPLWMEILMKYMFADNSTDQFHDFISIADTALRTTAGIIDDDISEEHINEVLFLMKHLPLKEGVQEALSALIDNGFLLAALTNAPEQIVKDRMVRTGLVSYFETILCAEQVGKFKPAKEVYAWAAKSLNVAHADVMLVSVHGWDIAGASNAGMKTAYLIQPGQMPYPFGPAADFTCKNLTTLVQQLKASPSAAN